MTVAAVVLAATCFVATERATAQPVDPDFLRMWEAAQRARPASTASAARMVSDQEPGQPLQVHGQLFDADGRMPMRGVVVFAYQTDTTGIYNRRGVDGWRLEGWARTDDEGRFTFTTIRPGPYPGRNVAAHIHIGVDGPPGQRHTLPDLLFDDDPLLSARELASSRQRGPFANIRPVVMRDGVQVVSIRYRLPGDFVF